MMPLAPIVLFIYHRPEHTRKTLAALSANPLASRSELFVYADGPTASASTEERNRIEMTRKVIGENQWCGKVNLIERPENIGLAANIIDGVTTLVNKYGKIIVLEDDIVTAPSFLSYMNDALDVYDNDEKVMHISGYTFPWLEPSKMNGETYFYRVASCWGWATWARAWKYYDDDPVRLFVKLSERNRLSSFDFEYSGAFLGQLNANIVKAVRTWAVKWYASIHLREGLALHPTVSLVNNIGFDNTGENASSTLMFENTTLGALERVKRDSVVENKYVAQAMYEVYRTPIGKRAKSFFANRIKNFFLLKYFPRR